MHRGDIVGIRGFPGKTKKGELSVFPTSMVVLVRDAMRLQQGHRGRLLSPWV